MSAGGLSQEREREREQLNDRKWALISHSIEREIESERVSDAVALSYPVGRRRGCAGRTGIDRSWFGRSLLTSSDEEVVWAARVLCAPVAVRS